MDSSLTIRHLGRISRARVQGREAQVRRLRDTLLLMEFRVVAEQENGLELRRRAYLLQDDWPVWVHIRRAGSQIEIDYALFIPWGWIGALIVLTILVLPFTGLPYEGFAFALLAGVIVLAFYQQQFDCRPNARYWQERPRRRWGEIMEQVLRETFDDSQTAATEQ